ncbi:MAG: transcriptional regulator [Candidatus Saccharimonadales bacterium]
MTERQKAILSAVVEQYAEVASPVGSTLLAKLFQVSSATIRAEMAELERLGYITQPHTSAGRIPTDKGYRFYVNQISEASQPGLPEGRAERALSARASSGGLPERTIRNTVDTLVELTHNLGLATIGNQLYMSGLSNLFGQPEFIRSGQVQEIAKLLDNLEPWLKEAAPNEPLSVYIGHENPIGKNAGASLIISRFRSPYSDHSYIGVLGPTRQSYRDVMTLVRHAGETLEEALY